MYHFSISRLGFYGREMAVPDRFGSFSTESYTRVSIVVSTSDYISESKATPVCEHVFALTEFASLAVVSLLAIVFLGVHLARLLHYAQNGVGGGVFVVDR
jgi:hypothetical protein